MKLIHCADLHLDSGMNTHLTKEQTKERKTELLNTFIRMTEYASDHQVSGILIAGDLFDSRRISAYARNSVYETILNHPDIIFFYLKGNHDADGFLDNIPSCPENLKLFGEAWTSYRLSENVTITGAELSPDNSHTIYASLLLQPQDFNIVMLHGQISQYAARDKAEVIDLGSLRNKCIQYLALGHVHKYQEDVLPPSGTWCYPGCLEGRGFDECGEHGFVLLDIDTAARQSQRTFVPFAQRTIYEVSVDISGCTGTMQIASCVRDAVAAAGCRGKDLVKIVLTGEVDVSCEKNTEQLLRMFAEDFYVCRIEDQSRLAVDYRAYLYDASLKGEFVRLVQESEENGEQEKAEIIRCGLQALQGEEIEL